MSVTSGIMLSDNMGASKDAMDEEGNAAADLGLVARIRESFDSLTATEREAAQFILGHLTDVLVCNSVELSQLSGISQPTLSRLYRKLGYSNARVNSDATCAVSTVQALRKPCEMFAAMICLPTICSGIRKA